MPRTKKRHLELFIVDIFIAIYNIKRYTDSFENGVALQSSSLHWDATIRSFEVIGEALNHLLLDEHFLKVSPAYFRKIVNFRNVIIHSYFGIDADEVWDIIDHKITDLHQDLLEISMNHFDLKEAIHLSLVEKQIIHEMHTTSFLQELAVLLK